MARELPPLEAGTTRVGIRQPLDAFTQITEEAIAGLIGQTVKVSVFGTERGPGTVVDAQVYEDENLGAGVWVTIDFDDETAAILRPPPPG